MNRMPEKYSAARKALAAAHRVDEVKNIRDKAIAMEVYAKQAKDGDLIAFATEMRKRAERRLGELIENDRKAGKLARGTRGKGRPALGGLPKNPPKEQTLAQRGVDKNLADRARKAAAMPEAKFEADVARTIKVAVAATEGDTAMVREARAAARDAKAEEFKGKRADFESRRDKGATIADLETMAVEGQQFSVIYADPPWEFKVYSGKGKQRSAERHYDTSSLDAIKELPVAPLAAEDCALFIWGVWPELSGVLEVVKAWGFEFKTAAFVWVKTTKRAECVKLDGDGLHWGMGYHTRANTEFCLLATKGSPKRVAMDVHQVVVSPVGEHSVKPEEVRQRIERLFIGPYLELFGRQPVAGWTVWGNEIEAQKEAAE